VDRHGSVTGAGGARSSIAVVPVLVALILAAVAAALAPVYLRLFRRELTRADGIEAAARSRGMSFSRGDPAYPGNTALRQPFELFSRGEVQTCENFVGATIGDFVVQAFDFVYVQHIATDRGATVSEPARYACALVTVGGDRPHVIIELSRALAGA
jgi:hypothetical protein